jgi:hypothetical protein
MRWAASGRPQRSDAKRLDRMLQSPTSTDEIRLADWLELLALSSADLNSSAGDLASVLTASSILDPDGSDAVESKVVDVFTELEARAIASGTGYPFEVVGDTLQARDDWADHSAYVFCLCLSYLRWRRPRRSPYFPERIFEFLCTEAARMCLNGSSVRFGSPRVSSHIAASFAKAIDELSYRHLREGAGFKNDEPALWQKDYGLDVVAWRDWPDRQPGKLVLFGNCASGWDWEDKLHELNPDKFRNRWMNGPDSPIIKALFVPHRVRPDRWRGTVADAGVLFERCRIANLTTALPVENNFGDGLAWIAMVIEELKAP